MSDARSSRELAERVERTFHTRGNRFRVRVWTAGLVAGVAATAWLAVAAGRGDRTIYAARPVSTPHRLFENDCQKCHTQWGAAARLVSLGQEVRSVSNEKCQACHLGPPHHANQIPAHDQISCAACHREHGGETMLTEVDDRHCTTCHGDLEQHGRDVKFATAIDRFDGETGPGLHPEFAIQRLLQDGRDAALPAEERQSNTVLEYFARREGGSEASPRWQDPGRIRFNHKLHLHARYENGRLVEGLRGPDGTLLDWSDNCAACHVPDASGAYMLPVNYESHCAKCHPLLFDHAGFPGETVPHERPEVVLGYLTEKYTLGALAPTGNHPKAETRPSRPFPGLPYRPQLATDEARELQERIASAERTLLEHTHALFGREARGGCRYCHEVEDDREQESWQIVPPRIPDRWLVHSRFQHESHRMLQCTHCHRDVSAAGTEIGVHQSESTGDVLMPAVQVCRQCHSDRPSPPGDLGAARPTAGARTGCVECHTYHHGGQPHESHR